MARRLCRRRPFSWVKPVKLTVWNQAIEPGNVVYLVGLVGNRELNGEAATVVKHDRDKDRFEVRMTRSGLRRLVREDNLCLVQKVLKPRAAVRIRGLKHAQHLNGERAIVKAFAFNVEPPVSCGCTVDITRRKETFIIKPENLLPLQPEFQ